MTDSLLRKQEMVPGTLTEAGSAQEHHTGSWRTYRPITAFEDCTHCLRCWIFCPDNAIEVDGGEKKGVDLRYCKGCGICATECPKQCIEMKLESPRS